MESELSGIFRVKLVTKNIVRGSPGTQFMHMGVNVWSLCSTNYFFSQKMLKSKQLRNINYYHIQPTI